MTDAFDQMKNLKEGNYTQTTYTHKAARKSQNNLTRNQTESGIKNFILDYGRKIVDFNAAIGIFIAIASFFVLIFAVLNSMADINKYNYNPQDTLYMFLMAIFIPLIILIVVVVSNYLLYLLIDIRDTLNNINQK